MSNPVEAGKASITITLDDTELKAKLESASEAVESLGADKDLSLSRGLGALGKAISMVDAKAGSAIGGLIGKFAAINDVVKKVIEDMRAGAGAAGGFGASAKALGATLVNLKIPHLAVGLASFKLGQWLVSNEELDESLYKLQDYASQYAKFLSDMASKEDAQIARLKNLAKAESLTNEEREKALELIKKLNAEGVTVEGDRVKADAGAWERLQASPDEKRIQGQAAIVGEAQENLRRLIAKRDALAEQRISIPAYLGITKSDRDVQLEQVAEEINKAHDKLRDEEIKLADLRKGESLEALKKQLDAEKDAINKRKQVTDSLAKIEQDAADTQRTAREKQIAQLEKRQSDELKKLTENGASQEQIDKAKASFAQLFAAINAQADKANQQAAQSRLAEIDKLSADFDRNNKYANENQNLELAQAQGGADYRREYLIDLINQYAKAKDESRLNLDELQKQLAGVDVGSDAYREIEQQYKAEFETFAEASKRWNELLTQLNNETAANVKRAEEYANNDYWGKFDAQNGDRREQDELTEFIDNVKSSGNVQALQDLANAASIAAQTARDAADAELEQALIDGELSDEEQKLIDAMREHAQAQEEQAYSLERSAKEAEKAARQSGMGSGGGFDAGAVIAKATAAAMRNDKSLQYQQKTSEGVAKLVELEKQRRDTIATFS